MNATGPYMINLCDLRFSAVRQPSPPGLNHSCKTSVVITITSSGCLSVWLQRGLLHYPTW